MQAHSIKTFIRYLCVTVRSNLVVYKLAGIAQDERDEIYYRSNPD